MATNRMPRNIGGNESERYLQRLTDRTFLSMWSHVGVFKDKKQNGKGDGKELCDVLAVFENHILIFSDKDWAFKNTGNLDLDWKRWYRRAVQKSAKQVEGAERWLRMFGNTRIFLDRACTIPFPNILPDMSKAQFHHILVAKNASKFCRERLGGSGSLMLNSEFIGDTFPFKIGAVVEGKNNIHVFDDTTLDVVLGTLDTVSDFVNYLVAKEALMEKYFVAAPGEEEVLANYFNKVNKQRDKHIFDIPDNIDALVFMEGDWADFLKSDQRKAQLAANKISYEWDRMIERFIETARTDNQYLNFLKGIERPVEYYEKLLRWLARENRTRRRGLAQAFFEWIGKTSAPNSGGGRVLLPSHPGDPHYVFFCMPFPAEMDEDDAEYRLYREARIKALHAYGLSMKHRYDNVHHLIAIATESGFDHKQRSEDIMYFDCTTVTDEEAREATKFLKEINLIKKTKVSYSSLDEFPLNARPGVGRNHSCPCGSGQRFKRCCGKKLLAGKGLKNHSK